MIGIGQAGLRVLQRLRYDLAERYGPADRLPARPHPVHRHRPGHADGGDRRPADRRLAGLHPDEVFPAKLNRAGHYLKPRLNGRR